MGKQLVLDVPEKIKILGISGSPRKEGNTAGMVRYALEWAKKSGYVETEYLSLANYKFVPCTGCMKCFGYMAPADDPYLCYDADDDIKIIAPKMAEADGILLGFPIYSAGIPGVVRTMIEKLHHFGPMSFTRFAGGLRYKVFGVISQGGQLYGGQELSYFHTLGWGATIGMYIATTWPTAEAPAPQSTFFGGVMTTIDGTNIYGKHAWEKAGTRTIPPVAGSRNERTLKNMGIRIAEAAMIMKLGRKAFKEAGYKEEEVIPFTRYSVKPKAGTYVEKLIKEGKVTFISQEELEAIKTGKH